MAAPNMEGKAAAVTTAGGHGSRGHENHRQVMAAEVTAAEVTAEVWPWSARQWLPKVALAH